MEDLGEIECRIGEASQLYGLTPRAIRLYEELKLLRPRRDAQNRRCYGANARRRLQLIATLRRVGLGLEEIRAILDQDACFANDRRSLMLRAVSAHVARVEAKAAEARAFLNQLALADAPDSSTSPGPRVAVSIPPAAS